MYLDLHTHLLWGIDDGPRSEAESVEMVHALITLGFDGAAPSPHCVNAMFLRQRLEEFEAVLSRASIDFDLYENTENKLSPSMIADVITGKGMMLARTRFFLVELSPFAPCPALPSILAQLANAARTALIAHPERSAHFLQGAEAAAVAVRAAGGLLQLDLGSLVGLYGRDAERAARQLLDGEHYAVAATDMHELDDARWIGRALSALDRFCGPAEVERLLTINPRRIAQGESPV
ncbi:MAG: protein tyrosine phosphatase [Myxococcales bacterium]|jgi:protein-tyrosine phosphatase|nr:protein tyrosine phosphatase [Myxococcales bacterium]